MNPSVSLITIVLTLEVSVAMVTLELLDFLVHTDCAAE